jgi:large subunit ribosomal protein L10
VVKNTLLKLAAEEAGDPDIVRIVEGPTALAIGYGDVIEASKAVTSYAQTAPGSFAIRGGYLEGSILTAGDLKELVKIPPRPVLIAQFMGQMQSPLVNSSVCWTPVPGLTGLFQSLLRSSGLVSGRQMEAA